jgi:hypothetical protein
LPLDLQAAGANLQLLRVNSGERVLDSMPALTETLGLDNAVATAVRNPSVLKLSGEAMRAAFEVLRLVLGRAPAVAAVGRNPQVRSCSINIYKLRRIDDIRSTNILMNIAFFQIKFELDILPQVLCGRSETMASVMDALTEVLGKVQAVAAVRQSPGILNALPETIRQAMPALIEIFGVERAMEVANFYWMTATCLLNLCQLSLPNGTPHLITG